MQSGKRTGTKVVATATSNHVPCGVFRTVQYYCQVSYVSLYYLRRYSSFCVMAPFWNNLLCHQLFNLPNTNREYVCNEIRYTKTKVRFTSFWNAFYISVRFLFLLLHRYWLKSIQAISVSNYSKHTNASWLRSTPCPVLLTRPYWIAHHRIVRFTRKGCLCSKNILATILSS